jgi:hypothetical protein
MQSVHRASEGQTPPGRVHGQMSEDVGSQWSCRSSEIREDVSLSVESNVRASVWASHRAELESQLCHSLRVWLWVSYVTSVSFNFCIFNLSKTVVSALWGSCENYKSNCKVAKAGLTHRNTCTWWFMSQLLFLLFSSPNVLLDRICEPEMLKSRLPMGRNKFGKLG